MALEENDGYLRLVVDRRPALTREVERLYHEHDELVRLMGAIHREVTAIQPEDSLLVREFCRRIDTLLEFVERHEADEELLMLDGVVRDLGTKD